MPVRHVLAALLLCGSALAAETKLDRAVEMFLWTSSGSNAARARELLGYARAAGAERHVRALENYLIADGIELARVARGLPVGYAGRPEMLKRAAEQLALAQPDHVLALAERGYVRRENGDLAGAVQDLSAVVAVDPTQSAVRTDLARTRWRMGDRETAVTLMDEGLVRRSDRANAEMFVRMLRGLARHGEDARALELARKHVILAKGGDVASAFHVYVAEAKIAQRDLAGAIPSYLETQVGDRTWLVGGMVRAGRELGATPEGRRSVLDALGKLPRHAVGMPSSALRMAGDLHAAAGQPEAAVRHYAAAITGGDEEARESIERVQGSIKEFAVPGSVVEMMARPEGVIPAIAPMAEIMDPRLMDPTTNEPTWARLRTDPVERSVETLLGSLPPAGQRSSEQIAAAVRHLTAGQMRPVTPTRARLIGEVLAGDDAAAKSTLDALALTSWQVNIPRAWGFRRTALPATSSVAVEPITQSTVRPESVDTVAQALRELNDPKATEQGRLARVMEVAKQEVDAPLQSRDPIAIDCDASGNIEMTATYDESRAVRFDLDGWGRAQRIQWLAGADGWLAEDVDRDGRISTGRELFGTAGGFSDGFEKLALRDANRDGVVAGAELAGLSIWIDAANPGVTDPGELTPVEVAGLTSITIPRVGLRAAAVLNGQKRLCLEVWPEAFEERFASF